MPINNFTDKSTSGFDEDALTTSTLGERIRNFARLTTSGDLADGISANADEVSILNFGEIETTGQGAAGIIVRGEQCADRQFRLDRDAGRHPRPGPGCGWR